MSIINDIWNGIVNFFLEYFVNEDGYNIFNTTVYITLGLVAAYLVYKTLHFINKKGAERYGDDFVPIKPNKEFFIAITPYIFLGATIRAVKDTRFIPDTFRLFETPLIYVFMIIYTILVGLFIVWISTVKLKSDWKIIFFGVGFLTEIMFLLPLLKIMKIEGIIGGVMVVGATTTLAASFFLIRYLAQTWSKNEKQSISSLIGNSFSLENILVLTTQLYDASATIISIDFFGYSEKHVLPDFLFGTFGTWVFWPVKFLIVFITLLLLDSALVDSETEIEIRSWLKWLIFLLGLATGTRDTLRLMTQT